MAWLHCDPGRIIRRSSFFLLTTFFAASFVKAQTPPRFLKYKIADSGCEAFFPGYPGVQKVVWDSDSAKRYEWSIEHDGYVFGLWLTDSRPGRHFVYEMNNEDYLRFQATYSSAFLERFKVRMNIATPTNIIWDQRISNFQHVLTAPVSFVSPSNKMITGRVWVDGDKRAFLYIAGDKPFPSKGIADTFLFGFRFP